MTPQKRLAHAISKLKIAARMTKEAEREITKATKELAARADAMGSSKDSPTASTAR